MVVDDGKVMELDVEFESDINDINVSFVSNDNEIDADFESGIPGKGGTDDYRKLKNKPSINGTELYDNYDEVDPTVPLWAKKENKPDYTPDEVGVNAISFAEIDAMFEKIWS